MCALSSSSKGYQQVAVAVAARFAVNVAAKSADKRLLLLLLAVCVFVRVLQQQVHSTLSSFLRASHLQQRIKKITLLFTFLF